MSADISRSADTMDQAKGEPEAARPVDPIVSDSALDGLKQSFRLWRFWVSMAWADWRRRYRRSLLGASWVFISFGLFIAVKVVIFGAMSQQELGFFAIWLAVGFLAWTYISSNIVEGCNVFINSERWIKGANLPYMVYIYQSVVRNIIQFVLSLGVVLIALVFVPPPDPIMALTALLSLPVYVISALWVQLLLAVICARFRDIVHLAQTIVRLLFFLTPILWVPADFGVFGQYADYNPFTHYLAIMREPLVSGVFPVLSWIVVGAMTLGGSVLAIAVFKLNRKRIVFWI